jgi:hypothetical protein
MRHLEVFWTPDEDLFCWFDSCFAAGAASSSLIIQQAQEPALFGRPRSSSNFVFTGGSASQTPRNSSWPLATLIHAKLSTLIGLSGRSKADDLGV